MGFASFLNIGPWPFPSCPPGSSARNYCIWTQLGTFCNLHTFFNILEAKYGREGHLNKEQWHSLRWIRDTEQFVYSTKISLCMKHLDYITDCWYSQQAKVAISGKQVQVQVPIHKCKCLLATSCHWRIFVCTLFKVLKIGRFHWKWFQNRII